MCLKPNQREEKSTIVVETCLCNSTMGDPNVSERRRQAALSQPVLVSTSKAAPHSLQSHVAGGDF